MVAQEKGKKPAAALRMLCRYFIPSECVFFSVRFVVLFIDALKRERRKVLLLPMPGRHWMKWMLWRWLEILTVVGPSTFNLFRPAFGESWDSALNPRDPDETKLWHRDKDKTWCTDRQDRYETDTSKNKELWKPISRGSRPLFKSGIIWINKGLTSDPISEIWPAEETLTIHEDPWIQAVFLILSFSFKDDEMHVTLTNRPMHSSKVSWRVFTRLTSLRGQGRDFAKSVANQLAKSGPVSTTATLPKILQGYLIFFQYFFLIAWHVQKQVQGKVKLHTAHMYEVVLHIYPAAIIAVFIPGWLKAKQQPICYRWLYVKKIVTKPNVSFLSQPQLSW